MFLDALQIFSDAQALTATAVSTNVIPLGPGTERYIGTGEPMGVFITIDVAPDETTGDETYTVTLQSDSADTFGSAATVIGPYTIPRTADAGAQFFIPIPPNVATEAYLRLNYTLGGTTPSVTLSAYLVPASLVPSPATILYPDAITIS